MDGKSELGDTRVHLTNPQNYVIMVAVNTASSSSENTDQAAPVCGGNMKPKQDQERKLKLATPEPAFFLLL